MNFHPSDNIEAYEQAALTYASRVMRHPSTLAVYQLGNINKPGVSDLDIITITRSDCPDVSHLSVFHVLRDNPQLLRLFLHDVAVFDENGYKDIKYIYYVSKLRHLAGEKLNVSCKPSMARNICIANLIEFCLPRIHRLGQLMQQGDCPRILLSLSLAYIHTAELSEKIGVNSQASLEFCDRAIKFRREVQADNTELEVSAFCNEARSMFAMTLNTVAKLLPAPNKIPQFAFLRDHERKAITFFREYNNSRMIYGNCKFCKTYSTWFFSSPSLYWYYNAFANSEGPIGTATRKALTPICRKNGLSTIFQMFLRNRVIKLNQRIEYLRKVNGIFSDISPRPGLKIL